MSQAAATNASSMEDRDGVIWMDGELVPWREARAHVLAHTMHHGLGIFEGVRAYAGALGTSIFRLEDHTRRFLQSAHILRMTLPYEAASLDAAQRAVLVANGLDEGYLRPIAFYGGDRVGVSARGNRVHVAVAAWRWDAYLGADAKRRGLRVKIASYCRIHHNSMLVRAKACGHYINSVLAHQEAVSAGYDEALLLDVHGYVAEASTSNLFAVRRGTLVTPPPGSILEGITRDTVIALAGDIGLPVVERSLLRDELYCADEAFVTGTAAEVTPVIEVDDRRIGSGAVGPVTHRLMELFERTVRGHHSPRRDWLSPVHA